MRISDWSSDVFSSDLVEKPAPGTAPFNLILPGRYILQPEVMKILETQEKGAGGEIQLTDAMASMIGTQPFHGVTFDGRRFEDRKSVVEGKSVSVSVAIGGRRILKKKK